MTLRYIPTTNAPNNKTLMTNNYIANAPFGQNELPKLLNGTTQISSINGLFTKNSDYLITARSYPLNLLKLASQGTATNSIKIANTTAQLGAGGYCSEITELKNAVNILSHYYVAPTFDSVIDGQIHYLNYEVEYSVYLPYLNFVQLNARDIVGKYLSIWYSVNLFDGSTTAFICVSDTNSINDYRLLTTTSGVIGADMYISSQDVKEVMRNQIGGIANMISEFTNKNVVGGITTFGATKEQMAKTNQLNGSSIGYQNIASPSQPFILKRIPRLSFNYSDIIYHYALYGIPTDKVLSLRDIGHGEYVEVDGEILLNNITRTSKEIEEIKSLLKSGVYL